LSPPCAGQTTWYAYPRREQQERVVEGADRSKEMNVKDIGPQKDSIPSEK
jgi:hypothetical protein